MSDCYPLPSPAPTLAGFQTWVWGTMGIPDTVLPSGSQWFTYAFNVAMATVNLLLTQVPGPIYMLAVYNLGGDNLINWAQDPSPPVNYPGTTTPYLQYLRGEFKISAFVPGVINSSADEGTSESMDVLEQYKTYTLGQLQNLKTPYGRVYLSFAASVGPLWGMS